MSKPGAGDGGDGGDEDDGCAQWWLSFDDSLTVLAPGEDMPASCLVIHMCRL